MLSIARCREILDAKCGLTDAEIETLRDQLAAIADIAFSSMHDGAGKLTARAQFDLVLDNISQEARYEVEERAAVLEFEAGMGSAVAERAAVSAWLAARNGGGNGYIN